MPDKELRKMSRSELIEIIYALQQNEKKLLADNEELQKKLDNRIIKMKEAGSIAEAALEINNVFEAVEKASLQYLQSIKYMKAETEKRSQYILQKANQEASRIIGEAKAQASTLNSQANTPEVTLSGVMEIIDTMEEKKDEQ